MSDILASWEPFRLAPSYVISDNDIVENEKRRVVLGFRSKGEPSFDGKDFSDAMDLTFQMSDFEDERRRRVYALITAGRIIGTGAPKRKLTFRWIKKSLYAREPGSAAMTSLLPHPDVHV